MKSIRWVILFMLTENLFIMMRDLGDGWKVNKMETVETVMVWCGVFCATN